MISAHEWLLRLFSHVKQNRVLDLETVFSEGDTPRLNFVYIYCIRSWVISALSPMRWASRREFN